MTKPEREARREMRRLLADVPREEIIEAATQLAFALWDTSARLREAEQTRFVDPETARAVDLELEDVVAGAGAALLSRELETASPEDSERMRAEHAFDSLDPTQEVRN